MDFARLMSPLKPFTQYFWRILLVHHGDDHIVDYDHVGEVVDLQIPVVYMYETY